MTFSSGSGLTTVFYSNVTLVSVIVSALTKLSFFEGW